MIGGTVALLCLAGAAVAYVLYDKYTSPDRSAPDVVVDNYLRAFLVDRNDVRAQLLVCDDSAQLAELLALRTELQAREERFQIPLKVSWGSLDVRQQDDHLAEVYVQLAISAIVDGLAQTDLQPWHLTTRLGDDWRVCGAMRAK